MIFKKKECLCTLGVDWTQVSIMVTRLKESNKIEYNVLMTQFKALRYDDDTAFFEILKGLLNSNGILNDNFKDNELYQSGQGCNVDDIEGASAPVCDDNQYETDACGSTFQ